MRLGRRNHRRPERDTTIGAPPYDALILIQRARSEKPPRSGSACTRITLARLRLRNRLAHLARDQERHMRFGYFTLSDNHYEGNKRAPNTFVADILDEAVFAEEVGLHSAWIGE